jgi:hypothetical protein
MATFLHRGSGLALDLRIPRIDSLDDVSCIFSVIGASFPSLARLSLVIDAAGAQGNGERLNLSGLFRLNSLEYLSVQCPVPLPLTDEDVEMMLSSCPGIQHLAFNPSPDLSSLLSYIGPLPTLDAIFIAASRGPRLSYLGICIDPTVPPRLTGETWGVLRFLDLGSSTIFYSSTARMVAELLHEAFPLDRGYEDLTILTTSRSWWVLRLAARFEEIRRPQLS